MKNEVIIYIKFITKISLWDSFKLRLAGGKAIKEFIEKRTSEIESKHNSGGKNE